jgi:glycosyltransferase involved in cell wall biosynthesis
VYKDGPPAYLSDATVIGMQQFGEEVSGDFEQDIERLVGMMIQLHRRQAFDVLHAQFAYPPGLAVIEAGERLKLPTVVSIQGGDGHWFGKCCTYHRTVMQTVLQHAGQIVVGSESFASEIRENNNVERRFKIVSGATDTSLFRPLPLSEKNRIRRLYNIPPDANVVVYHGRIDRRKGLKDLVKAIGILRRRQYPVHLVLSGVGPDEDVIRRLLSQENLDKASYVLGYVTYQKSPLVYAMGDVYCIPTYSEGFSNTIIEAMACGLPVVSTRVVGVGDVFRDTPAVHLVNAHNPKSLANGLQELLLDRTRQQLMGKAGRKLVLERYNWTRVVEKYVQTYEHLIRHPKRTKSYSLQRKKGQCRFRKKPQLL